MAGFEVVVEVAKMVEQAVDSLKPELAPVVSEGAADVGHRASFLCAGRTLKGAVVQSLLTYKAAAYRSADQRRAFCWEIRGQTERSPCRFS